eukprot:GHVU01121821.1.p1 GENE.GHVU01121821.1~~GHVU01121821.1.p1  ORF type:complete len:248 (-),score=43.10 GHVU01121821.1:1260-2003(-)
MDESLYTTDEECYHFSEEGFSEDDQSPSEGEEDVSWIDWFCHQRGNEAFVMVDEDWIRDDFNLTGLYAHLPNEYERALDLILECDDDVTDSCGTTEHGSIEASARTLYGLIHARYILTSRGQSLMQEKYEKAAFGRCPNTACGGCKALPVGLSDFPGEGQAKIFCPMCQEVYNSRDTGYAQIDGSAFGTAFPHLLLVQNPDQFKLSLPEYYVPRVYGFKVSPALRDMLREKSKDHPPRSSGAAAATE